MANNGKKLEKIVYLIQQTLKNTDGTEVYQNHKLLNDSGEKREFDVIIHTVINDFKLVIAIECKDYNKPIGVEKIEAFNSKCARVKVINKKVCISSKGFQSGAITAASDFGIDLYTVEDIASDLILSWISVIGLGLRYEIRHFDLIANSEIYGERQIYPRDKNLIFFEKGECSENLLKLLQNQVYQNKTFFWNATLEHYFKKQQNPELPDGLEFNMDVPFENAYTLATDGEKIQIMGVHADLITWIAERDPEIEHAIAYQPINGEAQAHGLKLKLAHNVSADLIFTGKGINIFYTDRSGKSHQLVKLGDNDPITGKFTKTVSTGDLDVSGSELNNRI